MQLTGIRRLYTKKHVLLPNNPLRSLAPTYRQHTTRSIFYYHRPKLLANSPTRWPPLAATHAIGSQHYMLTNRRFMAALTAMRYYVPGGNVGSKVAAGLLKRLLNGKMLMKLIGSLFGILRAATRLPVMMLTSAIGALAYVEYKLSQLNAPDWVAGGLEKMRGWLEGAKASSWLQSGRSSADNTMNSWGHNEGFDASAGYGSNGDGNGSGGEVPQPPLPKGGYYTGPDIDDDKDHSREREEEDDEPVPNKPGNSDAQDDNELMELTKKLLEIQTILKTIDQNDDGKQHNSNSNSSSSALQLPSIVVIGSQSSGKSSVLEAIAGQEFLPKGTNMVTRRPIELTLINTPHSKKEYGEFPQLGLDHITDFQRIQRTLYDLNMSVPETECVSDQPIELRIYSPNVPDLRLVDLPGYIQVVSQKQPPILRKRIRDLCEGYLKQPNIILAVCAADVDLANSEALQASRRNDPMGVRTIGVVTKVDTTEPATAVHMLTQNDYPLRLGYIGVVCKPVKEKSSKLSPAVTLTEEQYFKRHSEFIQAEMQQQQQHQGLQLGVGTLRRKLVRVLEEGMRRNMSSLVDAVRSELEETKYQIKVHYNDEKVSPESYMAESLDALKQKFKAFQQEFGKPQLRAEVQKWLESRVMDVCAELYWSHPAVNELTNHVTKSRAAGWWADVKAGAGQAASTATGVISELLAADTNKEQQKGPKLNRSATSISRNDGNEDEKSISPSTTSKKAINKREWCEDDDIYWDHQLDRASAQLTKSGVGRWTTQMVVGLLMDNITSMIDADSLVHHPETRDAILNFSNAILRNKYHSTVDQVENTIKPFKYEVEVEPHEWTKARKRSSVLVDDEIRMCRLALQKIRLNTPRKQLQQAMQFVTSAEKQGLDPLSVQSELARRNATESSADDDAHHQATKVDEPLSSTTSQSYENMAESTTDELAFAQFSPRLIRKAQQVRMIRDRLNILHLRRKALTSSSCASTENKRFCPEIFLDVVAEKLAYNAVLFINYELLQEFFFQFPRELDSKLYYGKSLQQTREFARQNPNIGKQLQLLERREKLELVMSRLQELARKQQSQFYERRR